MGEFSIFHWLIVLVILLGNLGIFLLMLWVAYRHGKKVGDQTGYIRGYKEGQQSGQKVIEAGTFSHRQEAP